MTRPKFDAIPQPRSDTSSSMPVLTASNALLADLQRASRWLAKFDIYVDNYLGLVQGDPDCRLDCRLDVLWTLLHVIDQVFCPLDADDPPARCKPASVKKFHKGDAYWESPKHILGWILNSVAMTLELLPHCGAGITKLLDSIPRGQRRLSM
jgi:hypothetical protein